VTMLLLLSICLATMEEGNEFVWAQPSYNSRCCL